MKKRIAVVALGGNALSITGTYKGITTSLRMISRVIASLAKKYRLVIISGSGPQVGNLLIQNERTKKEVPSMPLDVLDAEIGGELGYLIQQAALNELTAQHLHIPIATILTQVLVNKRDPKFHNPTKPVGPYYTSKQARLLNAKGIPTTYETRRGHRRVVPSPIPLKTIEAPIIKHLLDNNIIVIASVGGGIPVIKEGNTLKGAQAVIDKDLAAACLAKELNAELLLILTGIDNAYLNYGKNNEQPLFNLTLQQAQRYLNQGHFPEGSMGPKLQAAVTFLKNKGKTAIITSPSCAHKALQGKAGTVITRQGHNNI